MSNQTTNPNRGPDAWYRAGGYAATGGVGPIDPYTGQPLGQQPFAASAAIAPLGQPAPDDGAAQVAAYDAQRKSARAVRDGQPAMLPIEVQPGARICGPADGDGSDFVAQYDQRRKAERDAAQAGT